MDDCPEVELKKLCCTCLSRDRKLFQLCRLPDGVNNLYLLLSFDSEAYREGFYKDTASLYICWECRAVMCRISRFRKQACFAQRELTSIADGRTHIQMTSLSRLTTYYKTTYQKVISESNTAPTDNFIDCGLTTDIKSENEEDIPLSELHSNWLSDNETEIAIQTIDCKEELSKSIDKDTIDCKEDLLYKFKKKRKKIKNAKKKNYFSTVLINDSELEEIRSNNKMAVNFIEAQFKCDSCIEGFESQVELDGHKSSLHVEKPDHLQCDICLVYAPITLYHDHREAHYHRHVCQYCVFTAYNLNDMLSHLKSRHAMKNLVLPGKRKKTRHKTAEDLNSSSTPRRKPSILDKRTPYGYLCTECDKYFDEKQNSEQSCHDDSHDDSHDDNPDDYLITCLDEDERSCQECSPANAEKESSETEHEEEMDESGQTNPFTNHISNVSEPQMESLSKENDDHNDNSFQYNIIVDLNIEKELIISMVEKTVQLSSSTERFEDEQLSVTPKDDDFKITLELKESEVDEKVVKLNIDPPEQSSVSLNEFEVIPVPFIEGGKGNDVEVVAEKSKNIQIHKTPKSVGRICPVKIKNAKRNLTNVSLRRKRTIYNLKIAPTKHNVVTYEYARKTKIKNLSPELNKFKRNSRKTPKDFIRTFHRAQFIQTFFILKYKFRRLNIRKFMDILHVRLKPFLVNL